MINLENTPEESIENWNKITDAYWVKFENVKKLLSSNLLDIACFLWKYDKREEFLNLDDRILYKFNNGSYIVEYSHKQTRNDDNSLLWEKFRKETEINWTIEHDWNQFPEVLCTFEYEDKYYMFLYAHMPLNDTENLDNWIKSWVIFDPVKYICIKKEKIENLQIDWSNNVDNILKYPQKGSNLPWTDEKTIQRKYF